MFKEKYIWVPREKNESSNFPSDNFFQSFVCSQIIQYVLDFKFQTWHDCISMRNTFFCKKKGGGFVSRVSKTITIVKDYALLQIKSVPHLAICMVQFTAYRKTKNKQTKKTLQITTKSSLSLSCLSAKIVTVGYCFRLDKRQLSNHVVAFKKIVAVNTNTSEIVKLSCYLMWE